MMKVLKKLDREGMYLNIIKALYGKLIANIILSGETLKVLLKSRTKQECLISPFLFNLVLEVQAKVIRQEKERRWYNIPYLPVSFVLGDFQ